MRINLHQHTLKIKDGEDKTRNLDINNNQNVEIFVKNLQLYNVGIVAITNHNWFDIEQFNFLENRLKNEGILLLPGVEIDIEDKNNKGNFLNLTIVVSNEYKDDWNKVIIELVGLRQKANKYKVDLKTLLDKIQNFEKIFLVPNKQKGDKHLHNDDLELIKNDKNRIWFFETSNPERARILNNKNKPAFFGSDEHDILNPNYKDLPDPRIPIDNFKNLIKFLKRDPKFIGERIKNKILAELNITPNDWKQSIPMTIYRDINVIVGPKASGKTDLLKAIQLEIKTKFDKETQLYESSQSEKYYDMTLNEKKSNFSIPIKIDDDINNLKTVIENKGDFSFKEIVEKINLIKEWAISKNNEKFKCWLEFVYSQELQRTVNDLNEFNQKWNKFNKENKTLKEVLNIISESDDNFNKNSSQFLIENLDILKNFSIAKKYIEKILEFKDKEFKNYYSKYRSFLLMKKMVEHIKTTITKTTTNKKKPDQLGLHQMYFIRKNLKECIDRIFNWKEIELEPKLIGEITNTKSFYIKRKYVTPISKDKKDGIWNLNNKLSLTTYKKIRTSINSIEKNMWKNILQQKVNNFIKIWKENPSDVLDSKMFIWYKDIVFDSDNRERNPSSGEKQILGLMNYLKLEQDYYYLDEPDKSLDSHFINEVIIPKLERMAKAGKTLVIVTHNPNMGVRTYPYLAIYRDNSNKILDENKTYFGHPFIDNMWDSNNKKTNFGWIQVCEKILEGGKEAFDDRASYYWQ